MNNDMMNRIEMESEESEESDESDEE